MILLSLIIKNISSQKVVWGGRSGVGVDEVGHPWTPRAPDVFQLFQVDVGIF